jgi:hypothetical protein
MSKFISEMLLEQSFYNKPKYNKNINKQIDKQYIFKMFAHLMSSVLVTLLRV